MDVRTGVVGAGPGDGGVAHVHEMDTGHFVLCGQPYHDATRERGRVGQSHAVGRVLEQFPIGVHADKFLPRFECDVAVQYRAELTGEQKDGIASG